MLVKVSPSLTSDDSEFDSLGTKSNFDYLKNNLFTKKTFLLLLALSVSISVVGADKGAGSVNPPGTLGGCTGIAVRFLRVLLCIVVLRFTLEYTSLARCRLSKLLHSLSVSE